MSLSPLSLLICAGLLSGWGVAAATARELLRARRRLEAAARAEHELRGSATVLLFTCERLRRDPATRRQGQALSVELERLRVGLAALAAARTGPRRPIPIRAAIAQGLALLRGDAPRPAHSPAWRGGGSSADLASFAGSALDGWSPTLREAGRATRFRWDAGRVGLPAQRGAIASALGNLVANAAEHGEGEVDLRGSRVEDAVRVEIRNRARRRPARPPVAAGGRDRVVGGGRGRGRAIAAEAARAAGGDARGGDLGIAAEAAQDASGGGRGRGLAIAAEAARAVGGRITVERSADEVRAALELPIEPSTAFAAWPPRPPEDR